MVHKDGVLHTNSKLSDGDFLTLRLSCTGSNLDKLSHVKSKRARLLQ